MKSSPVSHPTIRFSLIACALAPAMLVGACGGGSGSSSSDQSKPLASTVPSGQVEAASASASSASAAEASVAAASANTEGASGEGSATSTVRIAASPDKFTPTKPTTSSTSTTSTTGATTPSVTTVTPSAVIVQPSVTPATATAQPATSTSTSTSSPTTKAEASTGSGKVAAETQVTTTPTPGPNDLLGLPKVGRIDAKSGQVIEGVDISNPLGPCVVIGSGIRNVTIRNSRIGPCGPSGNMTDYGVFILDGATNITIRSNVIHDVSTGIKAYKSISPLVIDRNYLFNIRGPYYNGEAIQFNGVSGGTVASKVTCNVSDATYGTGVKSYEDHISMFNSSGTATAPIEIAYNRVRGGTSKSGGGITVGDTGGAWIKIHDNIVVKVANTGIGVAGGNNITVENNRVDNRGDTAASQTGWAYYVRALSACSNITMRGNRGISTMWVWTNTLGGTTSGYLRGPEMCTNVTESSNQFGDTTLPANLFDDKNVACN